MTDLKHQTCQPVSAAADIQPWGPGHMSLRADPRQDRRPCSANMPAAQRPLRGGRPHVQLEEKPASLCSQGPCLWAEATLLNGCLLLELVVNVSLLGTPFACESDREAQPPLSRAPSAAAPAQCTQQVLKMLPCKWQLLLQLRDQHPFPTRTEDCIVSTAVSWVWSALLTRLVLDVSLGPTLGGDLRDVHLLILNLNLRRKTPKMTASE